MTNIVFILNSAFLLKGSGHGLSVTHLCQQDCSTVMVPELNTEPEWQNDVKYKLEK